MRHAAYTPAGGRHRWGRPGLVPLSALLPTGVLGRRGLFATLFGTGRHAAPRRQWFGHRRAAGPGRLAVAGDHALIPA